MNEKDLDQYFFIVKEIKTLNNDINELLKEETPESKENIDRIVKLLNDRLEVMVDLREKIENYINSIEDGDIRLIMRLRHISKMTWEEIGDEIYMSSSGVFKKYKKFLKKTS